MEHRDSWTDPQLDRWTYLILGVSLIRKIPSLPHSDPGLPEQNILAANVSNSRSPFLSCLTAAEPRACHPSPIPLAGDNQIKATEVGVQPLFLGASGPPQANIGRGGLLWAVMWAAVQAPSPDEDKQTLAKMHPTWLLV